MCDHVFNMQRILNHTLLSLDINLCYKPGQLIVSFKQSQSQSAQYSKRGNSAALHTEINT